MKKFKTLGALGLAICLTASLASCTKEGADAYNWKTADDETSKATVMSVLNTANEKNAENKDKKTEFSFKISSKTDCSMKGQDGEDTMDIYLKGTGSASGKIDLAATENSVKSFKGKYDADVKMQLFGVSVEGNGLYTYTLNNDNTITLTEKADFGTYYKVEETTTIDASEVTDLIDEIISMIGTSSVDNYGDVPSVTVNLEAAASNFDSITAGLKIKYFDNDKQCGIRFEVDKDALKDTMKTGEEDYDAVVDKIVAGIKEVSYSVVYDKESSTFNIYEVCNMSYSYEYSDEDVTGSCKMKIDYSSEFINMPTIDLF